MMDRIMLNDLGIPPYGGICSYEEACKEGYSVDENVNLLKRYNYVEARTYEILAAHLARTPEWEVKSAFGLHLWLVAEHSAQFRKRIAEMRQPPLHLDAVPDARLEALFDELLRSDTTIELLVGIYGTVQAELAAAYRTHLTKTNPLADHPTYRLLSFIVQDTEQMVRWGEAALSALLTTPEKRESARSWAAHLRLFLGAAGGIDGNGPVTDIEDSLVQSVRNDGNPYVIDAQPRRDERFTEIYNRTAKLVDYFKDENRADDERIFALFYKRLKEMDVPEWMAPILYKTKGKPWEYYVDLGRQLWDETRHALMGQAALYSRGMPFYKYPIDTAASAVLNRDFAPLEAHLILWGIEQGLMTKDGKQLEWQIAKASGDGLAILFQDTDWADEVLHSQIGRKWLLPEYESMNQMKETYKQLNAKFQTSRDELALTTETTVWWPDFIQEMRDMAVK